MDTLSIILTASAVVLGIVGFLVGIQYRKQIAEKTIGSAENRAKIIIKDAEKEAQAKKKEILVEAKEEIQRNRIETEKELKEARREITRKEGRIAQKEETLGGVVGSASLNSKTDNFSCSVFRIFFSLILNLFNKHSSFMSCFAFNIFDKVLFCFFFCIA